MNSIQQPRVLIPPTKRLRALKTVNEDTKMFEDFFLPSHMIYCNRTPKEGCTDAGLDLEPLLKKCSKKLHQTEVKQAVRQRDAHPAPCGCSALLSRLCGFVLQVLLMHRPFNAQAPQHS